VDEIGNLSPLPSLEAARDLVRAREECRADLMRARPRLSKLLLRLLRRQRLDRPRTTSGFVTKHCRSCQPSRPG
jgi:hypothetical protein